MTNNELIASFCKNMRTYAEFADQLGDMILCNEMAGRSLILENGEYGDEEVFQWYIIADPTFALEHTDELVFYDDELGVHVLGVTHWGTSWNYVSAPDFH